MSNDQDLKDLLMLKAKGYDVEEVVEEYSDKDGELVLTKKKVTHKYIPPDSTFLKMLIDNSEQNQDDDLEKCTEEELREMLKNIIEGDKDESNSCR